MDDAALSVFGLVSSHATMCFVKQCGRCLCKNAQRSIATQLPVGALHNQGEVIAVDVADKVVFGVANLAEQFAGKLNEFIALVITVFVVEGAEIV